MARSIMPSGDARKAASRAAFRATAGSRSSSASAQLAGVPEYSADRAAHLFGAVGEFRGRGGARQRHVAGEVGGVVQAELGPVTGQEER
jgi:hypothetical protein